MGKWENEKKEKKEINESGIMGSRGMLMSRFILHVEDFLIAVVVMLLRTATPV